MRHLAFLATVTCALAGCAMSSTSPEESASSSEAFTLPPVGRAPVLTHTTTSFHELALVMPEYWYAQPPCLADIAIGGAVTSLGCKPYQPLGPMPVAYNLHTSGGATYWEPTGLSETAVRVAAPPDTARDFWIIGSSGHVFKVTDYGFKRAAPVSEKCATEIGVGNNEDAWIIGCDVESLGGNEIYHLVGGFEHGSWVKIAGAATKISVSASGVPWVVNAQGNIYHWDTDHFVPAEEPGCAVDIAVSDWAIYVLGCNRDPRILNNAVYQWMGDSVGWQKIPGAAGTHVAASPAGVAWFTDINGRVFVGD